MTPPPWPRARSANPINVLANDTDPDPDDTRTITAITQPANGTVAITGTPGTGLTYTPNANFAGTDTFTYTIADAAGLTDTATVTVTVTNVDNDAPDAVNDTATVAEDSGANPINVLGNDTDPDPGDTRTITAITQPANGTVAITGTGTGLTYTPAANFAGTNTFTYTITDAAGLTDTATVTVTVTNLNDAPTAEDGAGTVAEDSTNVPVNLTTLTDDVDGDALTYTITTPLANGTLTPTGTPGIYTYTPNANFTGPDSFTYTVSDGTLTDTGTVTVTVTPVNDAPNAVDDTATVLEDSTANAINVLANDTDPDTGATRTITAVTQPANGTVVITGGGTGLTYTPDANYTGPDTFTYTISDGAFGTDTATVIDHRHPRQRRPDRAGLRRHRGRGLHQHCRRSDHAHRRRRR